MTQTQNGRPVAGAAGEQVGQTGSQSTQASDIHQPLAGWCPPGGCSARRFAEMERAIRYAFTAGRVFERNEMCETEATWKPFARKTYEQRVAERMASMPGSNPPPGLKFDDPDWPPVAVPGGGGVRLGPGQIITEPAGVAA